MNKNPADVEKKGTVVSESKPVRFGTDKTRRPGDTSDTNNPADVEKRKRLKSEYVACSVTGHHRFKISDGFKNGDNCPLCSIKDGVLLRSVGRKYDGT